MTAPSSPLLLKALEAGLALAGSRYWNTLTLIEIAKNADIALSDLYAETISKARLSDALESWADAAMFEDEVDLEDTARNRLFDVIMCRFERMETQRAGVLSLMKARDRDLVSGLGLAKARTQSAEWALTAAGLDDGTRSDLATRTLALAWIIAKTERTWRRDKNGDFAQTMALLDAELATAEERFERFKRFTGRRKTKQTSDTASTPTDTYQPANDETPDSVPPASDLA